MEVASEWARDEREHLERQFPWWIGEEEAAGLEDRLAEDLAEGRLVPESLWRVVEETADHWPAFRLLAFLRAYER